MKAFRGDKSQSQAGKVERGKNRMLVEHFIMENKRIIGRGRYDEIFGGGRSDN